MLPAQSKTFALSAQSKTFVLPAQCYKPIRIDLFSFSYTHDVEAVSCDEMLVDCTSLLQETGVDVHKFVTLLRQEIFEKTECTASAGLGKKMTLFLFFITSHFFLSKI